MHRAGHTTGCSACCIRKSSTVLDEVRELRVGLVRCHDELDAAGAAELDELLRVRVRVGVRVRARVGVWVRVGVGVRVRVRVRARVGVRVRLGLGLGLGL